MTRNKLKSFRGMWQRREKNLWKWSHSAGISASTPYFKLSYHYYYHYYYYSAVKPTVKLIRRRWKTEQIKRSLTMSNDNNTTTSTTGDYFDFSPAFQYPVLACHILIVIIGVIGNLIVCGAIIVNKNLLPYFKVKSVLLTKNLSV